MGKATQDLRNEHDAILTVLSIADNMLAAPESRHAEVFRAFGELVYFLRIFADKCHHGKEEGILFTEMAKKGVAVQGGPIGVMLQEHELGRQHIAGMSRALDPEDHAGFAESAGRYRDLLRSHIQKENNVLFPLADRLLDDEEQDRLFVLFERHEENVIGHGVHDKLHAMIDSWAEAFGG